MVLIGKAGASNDSILASARSKPPSSLMTQRVLDKSQSDRPVSAFRSGDRRAFLQRLETLGSDPNTHPHSIQQMPRHGRNAVQSVASQGLHVLNYHEQIYA